MEGFEGYPRDIDETFQNLASDQTINEDLLKFHDAFLANESASKEKEESYKKFPLISEEIDELFNYISGGQPNLQVNRNDSGNLDNQKTNESSDPDVRPTGRKGRKATILNPNYDQFAEIFTKLWDDIEEIVSSNQKGISGRTQSDVKNKKVIFRIRKFAKNLLNLFSTENQRKGKSDMEMYKLYKRCFEDGFLRFMTENQDNYEENKVLLFRDFINLSFPPSKAKEALLILNEDLGYQFPIDTPRPSTKKGLIEEDNLAFKIIGRKVSDSIPQSHYNESWKTLFI